ncbi:MAG: carboxynorspermidine decarboxylase [Candidatus Omnitrophica bacterium]|nr:carboxynorspermidine decarboxylase [Candidatus Omnitrophota bacterium]MCM8830851.1 carboxynorspermidine decarboxylase [Candidatus Omnitrophota bacterium]
MKTKTPYYLIDENKLLKNLQIIDYLRKNSGAKFVLALKCFSSWCVFGLIRKYMDGTTSSSLYEVRLGYEKFKKEVHAYSVGFSKDEIKEIPKYADKVIFNSISQLKRFYKYVKHLKIGIRINPGISYSQYDLANPARKYSRLGVINKSDIISVLKFISGAMFHFNCENDNFQNFSKNLDFIADKYKNILNKLEWVSLGGGIYFTKKNYPVDNLCKKLKDFANTFNLQLYLEPGEAVITEAGLLIAKVLDIVYNKINIAILDVSTEAHMLDLLVYRTEAKIENAREKKFRYMIAGRSCLAGDIFGTFYFKKKLKIGDIIKIPDALGYSIVKKNWFNGLAMPSIVVKKLDGSIKLIKKFDYKDYLNSLS